MATSQSNGAERKQQWAAGWGVLLGFVVGAFIYLPVTLFAESHLHVPIPDPGEPIADVDRSYWILWGVSIFGLALPGLLASIVPRTRKAAIGYLITVLVVGGLLAAWVIGFNLGPPAW
ncbi:hypothetical protein FOS14_11270 [Skermania sp. ID1734]|uniref:hypothetical protein n=1 Tax=Skermania sp. ID1734 TaxID=2597516 RepID=UPI00117FAAC3|nr:hypothetical protein [Skermania sp. ID1734]TSD99816.1 hypothetical protein FOS14_11270 [Skermania sp. ID1734]